MGKPRDIGIREDTTHMLELARDLVTEHIEGMDNSLNPVHTLLSMLIKRMEQFPEHCEFQDGCRESWEGALPMSIREVKNHE